LHLFNATGLDSACPFFDIEQDLEILILRYQLDVMVRLQYNLVEPNRAEKTFIAL
jgi:hypothetical protein